MEIKKGYKMTDVGVIPEDWEVKSIDNIGEFSKGSGISKSEAKSGTIKAIRYGELYTIHNYIIKKYESFISQEVANKSKKLTKGDIVFACSGETKEDIGKCAAFVDDCETYAGGDTIIFSPTIKTDSNYLGYILNSSSSMDQKSSSAQGDSVVHISVDSIRNIQIPLPDFSEQQAIADALTKVDNLITSLTKVIEKKKLIKKGAMQKLLSGEMRLDGFEGEWERKQIGKIGITYSGITGKNKSDFGHGTAKYITFLNVLNNPIINTKELELVDISSNENQNKAVKGDLFFNVSSETPEEVGICSVLLDDINNLYVNSFCFGFRITDKDVSGIYLSYLFRTSLGRDKMSSIAQGATRYNLSKDYFNEIELTMPPSKAEQTAIANVLTTMDNEIEALEKERDKYKCIKQGMMQQLLTGKIRLTCQ